MPAQFAGVDLAKISQAWAYAEQVANLLGHTYTMATYTARREESNPGALDFIKGWEVMATEDSCPYCKRAAAKKYTTGRPPVVPLHIGCRCSMVPILA